MDNTTDGAKQLVRFLREKGIKYIFAEETLKNEYIKKYWCKEFSNLLDGDTNGNLLKYFDKFFSRGLYNVISISFSWVSTKKGYEFWAKIEREWMQNRYRQAFIKN